MEVRSKEKMYSIFEEMFPIHFSRFFSTSEEINFIESLKASTELFVFSGVLRDFLLQYNKETPRDFDFVVKEFNNETKRQLSKYLIRRTQFGGYKYRINNKDIDIWCIEDTWAIKKYQPFYLQNYLPLTAFFNITAAVYCLNSNRLFIHESFKDFLEDRKHRKLDIVLKDNPYPALCVIKAIELMQKFGLALSDVLKDYLIRYNKVISERDYINIQLKHFDFVKYDYFTIQERIKSIQNIPAKVEKKLYDSDLLLFDIHELTVPFLV